MCSVCHSKPLPEWLNHSNLSFLAVKKITIIFYNKIFEYLVIYFSLDSGVGKSSIIVQQVSDLFLEDHGFTFEPTLEDIYKKQIIVGEEIFALEIVDTSGREDIRSDLNLNERYLEEGEGFMLVFDINDPKTFISALLYREKIIRLNTNKKVMADSFRKKEVYA